MEQETTEETEKSAQIARVIRFCYPRLPPFPPVQVSSPPGPGVPGIHPRLSFIVRIKQQGFSAESPGSKMVGHSSDASTGHCRDISR